MKCKHDWTICEWEVGYYTESGFVSHPQSVGGNGTGNHSPIKRAIKTICRKCLEKRDII